MKQQDLEKGIHEATLPTFPPAIGSLFILHCTQPPSLFAMNPVHCPKHLYVMLKKRASPSTSFSSGSFTATSACSKMRGSVKPA